MPARSRLIAAGVATLVFGLIVLFPARVAYRWFAPADVTLSGISGTVWNGRAAEAAAGGLYVNDLRWRFRPLSLFTGKAAYSIAADPVAGFIETDIAIGPGGTVSFSNLTAALNLASFENLVPMSGVEGTIALNFDSVVVRGGLPVEADGTVDLSDLVVRGMSPSPLGDYRAVVETTGNGIGGTVEDVSGLLDVAGTIQLRPDRNYSFVGQVAATTGAPSAIVQQLQYLGSPDAQGRHSFRFEGQL